MTDPLTVALYAALCVLRDAHEPFAPALAAQWRTVDAWLRRFGRRRGYDPDAVHQETILAVARAVREMRAATPGQAAAWLVSIHRRKRFDEERALARDATWRALYLAGPGDPFARLAAPEQRPTLDAERVVALLEQRIAGYVSRTRRGRSREIAVMQGRAALRRLVLEEDGDELAAALGLGADLSRDRLYKWIERGRAVVLRALDGWTDAPGELTPLVRGAMWARRADAGVPRPARRRVAAA